MAFKNDGVNVAEFDYDFAVDGGATGSIVLTSKANKALLPEDCIVKSVTVRVISSLTGAAASASIGNSAGATTFLALRDVDGSGADGLTADQLATYSTPFIADAANERNVLIAISGAAVTAGKLKVLVEYLHHEM